MVEDTLGEFGKNWSKPVTGPVYYIDLIDINTIDTFIHIQSSKGQLEEKKLYSTAFHH